MPAGVTVGAGSVLHLNKASDERKDIRLDDMYPLWRVKQGHAR